MRAALTRDGTVLVPVVDILPEVDSTNEYLKRLAFGGARSGTACLAEWQTCGRGRRGREWVSPFGANVYLSLLWRFSEGTAALGALSLAAAVAVKRALDELAAGGVELKWPNDVQWHGRKLAGILLELGGEADGPCYVVAGVGINVAMPESRAADIGQPWAVRWPDAFFTTWGRCSTSSSDAGSHRFAPSGRVPMPTATHRWC